MFENLFGKPKKSAGQERDSADAQQSTAEAAMMAAIEAQKKSDPLVGAKIAGKEIVSRLINGMKNEKGVHVESLLCALGALAGYSCQANLRAQAIARGLDPNAPFQVVKTNDGEEYYFGDPLNEALAEGKLSVWSLAGYSSCRSETVWRADSMASCIWAGGPGGHNDRKDGDCPGAGCDTCDGGSHTHVKGTADFLLTGDGDSNSNAQA